jgi:hypothetical protein
MVLLVVSTQQAGVNHVRWFDPMHFHAFHA